MEKKLYFINVYKPPPPPKFRPSASMTFLHLLHPQLPQLPHPLLQLPQLPHPLHPLTHRSLSYRGLNHHLPHLVGPNK